LPTLAHTLADPARLAVLRATGLIGGADAPASLDRLTRLAALTLDVPAAFLTVVDDDCQHVVSHVGLGDLAGFPRIPLRHSFCQHVVHTADVVVIADARDDPRVRDPRAIEELGVRAYAGAPLELDGQVLGAFGVADAAPRHWSARELEVLTHLALVAAADVALDARRTDVLVSQALDSSVLRHLPGTAVLRLDRDLRITLIEGSAVRERGWQPEALLGRRLDDVLPAEAFARLRPAYEAILDDRQEPFDYTSVAGEVWHCQGATIAGADGRPIGGTMVMRDVTRERRRERLLAERESQYRLLAERSTDVISRHDPTGRYTYLSPASAGVFGYAPEELLGRDPYDLIHPDDVDASALGTPGCSAVPVPRRAPTGSCAPTGASSGWRASRAPSTTRTAASSSCSAPPATSPPAMTRRRRDGAPST
jgi:PAS domain-containing protein